MLKEALMLCYWEFLILCPLTFALYTAFMLGAFIYSCDIILD